MRHTSAAAGLLATAVLGGLGIAPSAAAQAAPAAVRAAWVATCTEKKSDTTYPCGHWRLLRRDGGTITLRDASPYKVDGKGEKIYDAGSLSISADGRSVLYERTKDHRLVVRKALGGPATVLPKSLTPHGTENTTVYLSPAGDRVLVDYSDDSHPRASVLYTVATGKSVKLPDGDTPLGFSADGDEFLTSRSMGDNTSALVVSKASGGSIKRIPPQVVANAGTMALAADGKTVAVFVSGNEDRHRAPRLRLYDVATGELTAGSDLALAPGSTPSHADWRSDGKLTAVVSTGEDGKAAVVRVLTVDPESGAFTQADKYSVSKHRYTFYTAGM